MELVVETELEAARTGLGPDFVELETTDREVVVVVLDAMVNVGG